METELEQLRAENERLNKLLAEAKSFYGSTTWMEVRTPLNAVIGYADITLKENSENLTAEQRENLKMIKLAAKHFGHFLMIGNEIGRYGLVPNETKFIQIKDLITHFKERDFWEDSGSKIFSDAFEQLDLEAENLAIEIDMDSLDHALRSILFSFFDLGLAEEVELSFVVDQKHLNILVKSDFDYHKTGEMKLGYITGSIGWSAEKIVKLYGGELEISDYYKGPLEVLIKLPLADMEDADED